MPKIFNSYSSKLNSYVNLFGKHILQTDGKILTCRVCCTRVNGERKSLVTFFSIQNSFLSKSPQIHIRKLEDAIDHQLFLQFLNCTL